MGDGLDDRLGDRRGEGVVAMAAMAVVADMMRGV